MLPNWLYGKSKSKLAELLGGGGTPSDYNQVKAQVTQNAEDIALLDASNQALISNVNVLIENGAINLLPIKCPNQTENNITLANNNDGSVTISGTASTNTYFYLLGNPRSHLEIIEGTGKSYTLSGCTSGSGSTYALRMLGSTDLVAWYTVGQIQTTEEMTFTEGAYPYYALRLDVFSGASVNVTIKPMLVDSKYKGAYQPYAMTNKELTDKLTADANLGAPVDLSTYTSYSNLFTAPSDGYVHFQSAATDSTARTIYTYGNNTTAATDPHFTHSTSANNKAFEVFIKKGLKIYVDGLQSGDTINFYPLT